MVAAERTCTERHTMNTEDLAGSAIGKLFARLVAAGMESRLRYRFFGPSMILRAAHILPGQSVLEMGCGTGYFTLPAARLVGSTGSLVAIDLLPASVDLVSMKVQSAGLQNVSVRRADALATGLRSASFDVILLFGIIPAPMLPLGRLLPEMYRLLRTGGSLAVWPPVLGWMPRCVVRSGLFVLVDAKNGVYRFKRAPDTARYPGMSLQTGQGTPQ